MKTHLLKISPHIDNDKTWIESFKSPYIVENEYVEGEYLLESLPDKDSEEFAYLPKPINPSFTSKVLNDKKFKVREISSFKSSMASIDYFIGALRAILKSNETFKFDIDQIVGSMELIKIPHTDSEMDWDWDLNFSNPKLTLIVPLNDPSEYEGGEFKVWMGKDNIQTLNNKRFSVNVFPSFCMSKITPITKGTKHYLKVSAGSNNFM